MTATERNKDADTPTPEIKQDRSNGDGIEKPGLIIDVVLPTDKPEIDRDPKKQN